jgi:hypothetical protein
MRVRYSDYGVGGLYGNTIEISKDLKQPRYSQLRRYVILHELSHRPGFDLLHDLKIERQTFPLMLFIISHPKTWTRFLPFEYRRKHNILFADWNLLALYTLLIGLGIVLSKLF